MSIVKHCARASVSLLALASVSPAFAQTTGQQDFDQQTIIVTGGKIKDTAGITIPPTSRAKETINSDLIQRETPGQSILDTINGLPGVSFQNNDAYGASGGTLNIRGFDASRIELTLDGLPLNDTGNYALYSGQQLDPELIDQITVSLGSADVDAPTAAASGSTVNYSMRNPTKDFHVQLEGSIGQSDMLRIFGVVDTGTLTSFGTRALISASKQTYNNPFNNIGKLDKTAVNAKIYQPIGDNGDFFSVAGNYDQNRNDFFGSAPLRTDLTISPVNPTLRTVGTGSTNRFPLDSDERDYFVAHCTTPTGVTGRADAAGTCGMSFDQRYNPSNTGNVRFNSRFTLTPKLVLTVDAGYEYTLANGGGTATANEGFFNAGTAARPVLLTGYYGGQSYLGGVDLNGDHDTLDKVTVSAPSATQTNRYLANVGLRYSLTPDQIFRIGYSLDYGHHRQTGEITTLQMDGFANGPFPSYNPILDSSGHPIEKRDRLSYAILNQAFGEYRGTFFDKLVVNAGLRAPFFERNLHQYCFTTAANGNVDCTGQNAAENASYAALHPYVASATTPTGYAPPQDRILHYNKLLPSAGFVYNFTNKIAVNANYSKGLQVPGTDNLYQGFYFPAGTEGAKPKPETTDNFDAGVRYTSGKLQAFVDGWYTIFHNRLAASYDPNLDQTVYRNLGTVHKYGVDGTLAYQVLPILSVRAFGSYLKSKILDNNNIASKTFNCDGLTDANVLFPMAGNGVTGPLSAAATNCAVTAGKRESGAPTFTFGGRVQGDFGPLSIGTDIKRTGPRYVNDQNLPILQAYANPDPVAARTTPTLYYQVYGAKAPAYTLVNLDARFSFTRWGANERTFLQLNVYNLFNKFYVGGVSGGTTPRTTIPFAQIGVPRTISGTLSFGF